MNTLTIDNLSESFVKEDFIDQIMMKNNIQIEFFYGSNFKNAKILRDFTDIIFKKLHISPRDVSRFILVVDEMNNNAIEYGSSEGEENILRMIIAPQGDSLNVNVEVEDTGTGKKHKTAEEMDQYKIKKLDDGFSHHKSIRGRGLFLIIENIVDRLYFRDSKKGGLIVGVEKDIAII